MGRNFTPEVLQALDAPFRNALAPRGGLAFDGTASSKALATLTGQTLGTDPHSVVTTFEVPSVNPSVYRGIFSISSDPSSWAVANAWQVGISAAGNLSVEKRNSASSNARTITVSGFVTSYAGKIVNMALVRNGSSTPTIYINGVAQAVTLSGDVTVDWGSTTPSTYLLVGIIQSDAPFVGKVYSATLYNCALAQADVTEIYELGGAVPERFKFGTQLANKTSPNGYNPGTKTPSAFTATMFAATSGAGNCYYESRPAMPLPKGMYVRVSGNVSAWSGTGGSANSVNYGLGTPSSFAVLGGYYQAGYTGANNVVSGNSLSMYLAGTGAFSTTFLTTGAGSFDACFNMVGDSLASIDSILVQPLGAVVHLPLNDNAGLIAYDTSTNALNATITATGVTWVLPPSKVVQVADGTAALPSISFAADTDTGFYRVGPNEIGVTNNGTRSLTLSTDGVIKGVLGTNYLELNGAGSINIVAGGTAKNITLTPSTIGFAVLNSGSGSFPATFNIARGGVTGGGYLWSNQGANVELTAGYYFNGTTWVYGSTGAVSGIGFGDTNSGDIRFLQNAGGSLGGTFTPTTVAMFKEGNGRFLLGTTTDSSNGLLQLSTNALATTSAYGIGFGTDTSLYRSTAGQINLDYAGDSYFILRNTGVLRAYLGTEGTNAVIAAQSASLVLKSANTTALTLDASQRGVFAADVILNKTGSDPMLYSGGGRGLLLGSNGGILALTLDASQNATFAGTGTQSFAGTIGIASGKLIKWAASTRLDASANGSLLLADDAGTSFTRLQFGGTTASFPALQRTGTTLQCVDATGGSYVSIYAGTHVSSSAATSVSAGQVSYGATTATTVGAAGGASALPATPLGYIIVNVAGTAAKIPYYNS